MPGDTVIKTALNAMYLSGAQAVTGFWLSGLGAILMLHHVRPDEGASFDPNAHLSVTPRFLGKVLGRLKRAGCEFVSMDTLVERIVNHDPRRDQDPAIAITLDDAYRDNLEHAVPLFRKYEVPYTIYVAPGLVEGSAHLWWEDLARIISARDRIYFAAPRGRIEFDLGTVAKKTSAFNELLKFLTESVDEYQQREIVSRLAGQYQYDQAAHCRSQIMSWDELRTLAGDPLCCLGAHTVHHYAVARLSPDEAVSQMRQSAGIIEMETGSVPSHFAFPYGYPKAAGKRDFKLAAEAGFRTAVTTRHGVLYGEHGQHLHALPRISLNGRYQAMRYVDTLLSGLPTRLFNNGSKLNVD